MTDLLVNALSVTNQSGLHVLAGHLDQLSGEFSVAVIARPSTTDLRERFAGRVGWIDAPEKTSGWLARAVWEFLCLEKIARDVGARFYFTPSGIAAHRLSIPQAVLCQNPWALVPAARRRADAPKAWLQRCAYRRTMRCAELMVFNSEYMRKAYRQNAGFHEKQSIIATQAADSETRRRAQEWRGRPRVDGQILCVSAMAPHKNVEAVIEAFHKLPESTTLRLVGSWPDSAYEVKIRTLVGERRLGDRVFFDGFISREELDRLYAESQVFCLMSRCESFGIPAIEAQLFGTPVVCSKVCAVPEVCGESGVFVDPDDIAGIAQALEKLLSDSNVWKKLSEKARFNADRFHWETCSKPLVEWFKGAA